MNVLIVGEIGIGKSTLINELLQNVRQPVFGFRTEKTKWDASGNTKVHIHPASGEKIYSDENVVGVGTSKDAQACVDVFDTLGVRLLTNIPAESVVLMDELGFIESNAPIFCNAVTRILDGSHFALAAVKTKSTPFLEKVRSHQDALVYTITIDNRDSLYEQILYDLSRLDSTSPFLPLKR